MPPPSAPVAACVPGPISSVALPPDLAKLDGAVGSLTPDGELLITQQKAGLGGGVLTVLDPTSGATTHVVTRAPGETNAKATRQVTGNTAANRAWVAWEESGFSLEVGDWTIWSMERSSGRIRKVASFEPGSSGAALPGWPSSLSLLGDLLTWSANVESDGKVAPRIYLADLGKRTVGRLGVEGRFPAFVAADQIAAVVRAGSLDGHALAVPATVSVTDDSVRTAEWVAPARNLAFGASEAGVVEIRLVKEATAEDPVTVADVVTRDSTGVVRTFPLPNDWGYALAGTGFLAWSDASHLWILPSGQSEPKLLLASDDPDYGLLAIASGPTLYWRAGGLDAPATNAMLAVSCPS
jgi:hypothetical protein